MLNKNSLVRFKNRAQISTYPMRVEAVKVESGRRILKVNGKWWAESSFISDIEWVKRNGT
jgi:hypothetical protein